MTLFRITPAKLEAVPTTTFAAERLMERRDLQRLLRENIGVLADDLIVIAEEFGNWQDSSRRIDLLCLSRDACLVVVEIKRTEDGGHMELQAVRYAAMVSSMTLEQVIDAYARSKDSDDTDAVRRELLAFLQADEEDEVELTGEVRIMLVSADFSTEVTTAVLWLNRQGLDIRCLRLRPYRSEDTVLVDVTQIIPLPEAAEYEVKLREQAKEQRKASGPGTRVFRGFWESFLDRAENRTQLLSGIPPSPTNILSIPTDVEGVRFALRIYEDKSRVFCLVNPKSDGEAKRRMIDDLHERREEIATQTGLQLDWLAMDSSAQRRIRIFVPGGWKLQESEWPEFQDRLLDALIALEAVLRQPILDLTS